MPARLPDEIDKNDPASIVRRFTGPEADEIFLLCRPRRPMDDVAAQAESVCKALLDLLASCGASHEHVVGETVFFRHIREDLSVFLDARRRLLGDLPVEERLEGTLAAVAWCAAHGASAVRVHDVRAAVRTLSVVRALR